MAVTFSTTYPADATDAAWQKQKSFKDKLKSKTKTGLGAALKTAEAEWKKINFAALDARHQPRNRTPNDVRRNKENAAKLLAGQVKTAARAVEVAASKARVTSANPALSPKAAAAAKAISAKLLRLAAALKSIKLTDFDNDAQELTDGFQKDVDRAVQLIAKLDASFDKLYRAPTAQKFTELKLDKDVTTIYGVFTVGFRSMEDPRFITHNDTWKNLAELVDRMKAQVEGNKAPTDPAAQKKFFQDFVLKAKPLSTRLKALK